jgi:hypothetical protein
VLLLQRDEAIHFSGLEEGVSSDTLAVCVLAGEEVLRFYEEAEKHKETRYS